VPILVTGHCILGYHDVPGLMPCKIRLLVFSDGLGTGDLDSPALA
jgi:hypothetical protein